MNLTAQQQAAIRHVITLISGLLMMHGFKHAANFLNVESNIEELFALGGIVFSLLTSHKANTDSAIVQKAAEIIPANTVIVGTPDNSPKATAQVVSPEFATAIIRKADVTPIVPIKDDAPTSS